jgi:AAHS family 4-hydroxybenzoate transporter-like MFS transporter
MALAERAATSAAATIDVADFIDRKSIGSFQIRILLMCFAVLFVDGYDTQALGYIAPALSQDWKLARGALGPVFSASLFGLMIGVLTLSPIADRIGRKRIIIFSAVAFGVGSLATAFVPDYNWLFVMRFLTGLGLGGALPNAIALTAEFSPHRRRATMVMAMFVGFSVGAAVGGFVAAALLPEYGWRSIFVVGGIVPLLLAPLVAIPMPESIRYLALAGNRDSEVADLLTRVAPDSSFPPGTRFAINEPAIAGMPVGHLFREGRTIATILFWVVFFMSLLDIYLLANWLSTVLNDLGVSVAAAAAIASIFQVGGVVGALALGNFIDRFTFRAMSLIYLLTAAAIFLIGQSGHSIPLATVAIFLGGFFLIGGQNAANALSATFYPTMVRSTGVGWALGIGRIGSIIGPFIGGMMLARQVSTETLFTYAAVPALIACLASFLLVGVVRRLNDANPRGVPADPAPAP